MISLRKLKANRANARASTGPRSAAGKLRAAHNSRRHGLSVPVWSDPVLSADAGILALEIAGPDAAPNLQRLARVIAEAQIDLKRVRQARHRAIVSGYDNPLLMPLSALGAREQVRTLIRIDQLMKKRLPIPWSLKHLIDKPEGAKRLALVISTVARLLTTLDRYERRALSRRDRAIHAFDKARLLTSSS
jgi:hypothetical protein